VKYFRKNIIKVQVVGYIHINRLRVFDNGVLRRIFAPKRDEVTAVWGKLHNAKLNGFYY